MERSAESVTDDLTMFRLSRRSLHVQCSTFIRYPAALLRMLYLQNEKRYSSDIRLFTVLPLEYWDGLARFHYDFEL